MTHQLPRQSTAPASRAVQERVSVELFVGPRFNAFEASAITRTLSEANQLLETPVFAWRYVSNNPGLLDGADGLLVRAEPAIANHGLSDMMIVLGGQVGDGRDWLPRVRQMQHKGRQVVLLSDAATAFIRAKRHGDQAMTTHWRDVLTLREEGYYPGLSERLAEQADGVITAAGQGATAELILGLISKWLEPGQVAELGNALLLPTLRKSDAEQPRSVSGNASMFDSRVTAVISLMEDHIADPLDIPTLTQQVGLSSRQVERVFREVFNQSPARFYKQLRTKRARALIEETLIPLADIAVATGFGSVSTMAKSVRDAYGMSPSQARARKSVDLMKFK